MESIERCLIILNETSGMKKSHVIDEAKPVETSNFMFLMDFHHQMRCNCELLCKLSVWDVGIGKSLALVVDRCEFIRCN